MDITAITGLSAFDGNNYYFPQLTDDEMKSKQRMKRVIKKFLNVHKKDVIYCSLEWEGK